MRLRLGLVTAGLLVAGCGGGFSAEDEAAYLAAVRAQIPSASAYPDDSLLNMAENVCALGDADSGVEVLDNYSQIEASDRKALAIIALDKACPDESGE